LVTAALTEARCFEAKLPEVQQEPTMKKIIILVAVAFALATGAVSVLTVYAQQATDSGAFRPGMLN
jgi:Na+(H+)/acetate symporter ActP